MLRNIYPIAAKAQDKRASTVVLVLVLACHAGWALLFKLGFFEAILNSSNGSQPSSPSPSPSPSPTPTQP